MNDLAFYNAGCDDAARGPAGRGPGPAPAARLLRPVFERQAELFQHLVARLDEHERTAEARMVDDWPGPPGGARRPGRRPTPRLRLGLRGDGPPAGRPGGSRRGPARDGPALPSPRQGASGPPSSGVALTGRPSWIRRQPWRPLTGRPVMPPERTLVLMRPILPRAN